MVAAQDPLHPQDRSLQEPPMAAETPAPAQAHHGTRDRGPQGRRADRLAHLLPRPHGSHRRPVRRFPPGRRQRRHGGARPADHGRRHDGHDDPPRAGGDADVEEGVRRRRHAVRLLRGQRRAGLPQRRADHEGDRLPGGEDRGGRIRRGYGAPSGRPRHPRDGACRAASAGDQCRRRLQGQGPRARRSASV